MAELDVIFANQYFAAADASADPAAVPLAWRPLVERRAAAGIEPVQFALAGMLPALLPAASAFLPAPSRERGAGSADQLGPPLAPV